MVLEVTVTDIEASLRFYMAAGLSVRFRHANPAFTCLELEQVQPPNLHTAC